jgi:hypothetical protein
MNLLVRILKRGYNEGMQALKRAMLSSRQLQTTDGVIVPVFHS